MKYTIILYYKYATVRNPELLMKKQRELCEKLGLKGRVIVAHEGINGTLEGESKNVEKYVKIFTRDPRFKKTHIKRSIGDGNSFPKLSIKVREDLVSNKIADWGVDPRKETGKHLAPEKLHEWYAKGEQFEIVDMRNDYEHKSGYFEGSILAPVENFRDLPKILPKLAALKKQKKKILTVCTGGVRCEKASALLLKNGFKDVYQLDGGIVSYMEKYPNEDFKGKLYVFDKRITMGFETDSPKHEVIGKCVICGVKSERYINCQNLKCHIHFISCVDCGKKREDCCSEKCMKIKNKVKVKSLVQK